MIQALGDEKAGFEIVTYPAERLIRARVWGFWERPLAILCRDALLASFTEMGLDPWCILSDNTRFAAQKPDVQALISEVMNRGPSMGLHRVAFLVDSPTTRLQMTRLATENHMEGADFFTSEDKAMEWLIQP